MKLTKHDCRVVGTDAPLAAGGFVAYRRSYATPEVSERDGVSSRSARQKGYGTNP